MLSHGIKKKVCGAHLLDEDSYWCPWRCGTAFPLVCGILICFRHVILGKRSRWKSCFQHRFQHHFALTLSLFIWHGDSHPGLCAEKANLLAPGSQNLDLFNCKQNPGRKFENHLWVERENCGCTLGNTTVCSSNNQEKSRLEAFCTLFP